MFNIFFKNINNVKKVNFIKITFVVTNIYLKKYITRRVATSYTVYHHLIYVLSYLIWVFLKYRIRKITV